MKRSKMTWMNDDFARAQSSGGRIVFKNLNLASERQHLSLEPGLIAITGRDPVPQGAKQ